MTQDTQKKAAAQAALDYILPALEKDTILGIGTGSTANAFIDFLATYRDRFDGCVASSEASAKRLQGHGMNVYDLNSAGPLRFYIDGADEVDTHLNLTKGGGAALTREKIVAEASDKFICIVDESKCSPLLGNFPIPVEVIPMARSLVARAIVGLGGDPEWRPDCVTDNGNVILDVYNLEVTDPAGLEKALNQIPGVVTNGIFARNKADICFVAGAGGVQTRTAQ